jgi:predicted RNA methylase
MLKLAGVTSADTVYDLGSGDGRILILAAKKYGARGVGIEIDPKLVAEARKNAAAAGVADRVTFRQEDLFKADLSNATVVTLYLSTTINMRLQPKLLRELKPGSRVVSHRFLMRDWEPEAEQKLEGTAIYRWTVRER